MRSYSSRALPKLIPDTLLHLFVLADHRTLEFRKCVLRFQSDTMMKGGLQIGDAAQETEFRCCESFCSQPRAPLHPMRANIFQLVRFAAQNSVSRLSLPASSDKACLDTFSSSMVDCTQSITPRLNSTCSRMCQSSARATLRFKALDDGVLQSPGARIHGSDARHFGFGRIAGMQQRHQDRAAGWRRMIAVGVAQPHALANFGDHRCEFFTFFVHVCLLLPTRCDFRVNSTARGEFAGERRLDRDGTPSPHPPKNG